MTVLVCQVIVICQNVPFSANFITTVLARIRSTFRGPEIIPFWFYRMCAAELGPVVARLINFSLQQRIVCSQLGKLHTLLQFQKFHILQGLAIWDQYLSSLFWLVQLKSLLTAYLMGSIFSDQYAYKSADSTTCALADLTYQIHTSLETNQYFSCVLIDVIKAFDMVNHPVLAHKLPTVLAWQVPLFLIQGIMSFLMNWMQATRVGFSFMSSLLQISRSIVWRPGFGPTLFICFAHDLKPQDTLNYLPKYADDSTLLCPQNSNVSLEQEMQHVINWAANNDDSQFAQDSGVSFS